MSSIFRASVVSHVAAIALGAIAATAILTAYSANSRSLADYISAICAKPFRSASATEAPYLAENVSAMTKMMIDMGISPSGDVDTDFVAMMAPHHQGAIEMAQAELRYGHNEPLRRMAQEIIVTQLQEIAAMPPDKLPPRLPIPTFPLVIRTASTRRSSTRTPSPSQIPSTTSIRLGDPLPANLSPLYRGQLLVHGMGFSPDHRTIAVVAIGSNAVNFIDTATNSVKHVTYVGRSPHEAFYTMDGSEVWVVVRGENYVSVLDGTTYEEKTRITVPNGPGMTIFSPDGKYGYVCSSFTPETEVITVADHKIVGMVPQASPFCPNIAATPDSQQVWFTLKDSGKTQVFDGQPPFGLLKTLDTGPITNHVNIVRNANGMFAYVTIGGLNEIKVFRTDNFEQVATIPTGRLPHGIWPSGDGTRVYVGLENEDKVAAIDTLKNEVIATSPIGQAPQALAYVPDAVPAASSSNHNSAMTTMTIAPEGLGTSNLQPLGVAGQSAQLWLGPPGAKKEEKAPTSVSLSDQGLVQVLEAAVTGLEPGKPYLLALATEPSGSGVLEPLQGFMTNPAGAAIVNTIGPIRQLVRGEDKTPRRYLVILPGTPDNHGAAVQVQSE